MKNIKQTYSIQQKDNFELNTSEIITSTHSNTKRKQKISKDKAYDALENMLYNEISLTTSQTFLYQTKTTANMMQFSYANLPEKEKIKKLNYINQLFARFRSYIGLAVFQDHNDFKLKIIKIFFNKA